MTHTLDILLQVLVATIIILLWLKVISSFINVVFDLGKKRKVMKEIDKRVGQLDKLFKRASNGIDKAKRDAKEESND